MKRKIAMLLALTLTVGCIGTGCGSKKQMLTVQKMMMLS